MGLGGERIGWFMFYLYGWGAVFGGASEDVVGGILVDAGRDAWGNYPPCPTVDQLLRSGHNR